jgi:glyoxylase-like metal-dependent hydrolase (beta-lactamase superfamily II)
MLICAAFSGKSQKKTEERNTRHHKMEKNHIFLEQIVVGPLAVNCYLLGDERLKKVAIIDPGCDEHAITAAIERHQLTPVSIINTHGHIDHVGANKALHDKYDIPLHIHEADGPLLAMEQDRELQMLIGGRPSPPADAYFAGGDTLKIGDLAVEVLHTPGHTPGSVCLKCPLGIITGDTLFNMGIGRTDLPGGDMDSLFRSIREKLYVEDASTVIYPGHGPTSTIGDEMTFNPFVRHE